jgi:hypothetical protein
VASVSKLVVAIGVIPTRGCPDDPGTKGARLVGHAGDAYRLRSGIWIDRTRGLGIAYFVTGVPDDPPDQSTFIAEESAAFRRAYALLKWQEARDAAQLCD